MVVSSIVGVHYIADDDGVSQKEKWYEKRLKALN